MSYTLIMISKSHKKVSLFFYIFVIFILILFFSIFIVIKHQKSTPTFAFYHVPDLVQKSIVKVIEEKSSKKISIIQLDSGQPLSSQKDKLKNNWIIFAANDADIKSFAKESSSITQLDSSLTEGFPYTIKSSIPSINNKPAYIPFLYDMYEIDINYKQFQDSSLGKIETWSDLYHYGLERQPYNRSAFSAAFYDPEEFLNLFGQLMEAVTSINDYEIFCNNLYSAFACDLNNKKADFNNTSEMLKSALENKDSAAFKTLEMLNILFQNKIIDNNIFNYTAADLSFSVDNGMCAAYFTKLSDHRKISRDIIGKYRSIYIPSISTSTERKFSSIEYIMLAQKNNNCITDLAAAISNSKQELLCKETGLAPVQKNSQVPDHQADDVRYWLAASLGPATPLAGYLPDTQCQNLVAELIKSKITF